MTTRLKERAWQSGLFLSDETTEWNNDDWPPLEGGARYYHASVVLNHPDTDNNNKRQTVVVLGGHLQGQRYVNSVRVLDLSEANKKWRAGTPMNKTRYGHAAVVCNGGIYVMGGYSEGSCLNCIERIDANDVLQLSLTTSNSKESQWTTLTCRLSRRRFACCAVAVHNRYIVVMSGNDGGRPICSSVDIIDANNHIVTAGPSMNVPRRFCASAVVGHRIFVVGGRNENGINLDSVEYMDFAKPCDSDETRKETASTVTSSSSSWTTHSDLVLSEARHQCAVAAVGSCLVVAGGSLSSVEILDTNRNSVWNLPPLGNRREDFSMVTLANQVAVISGFENPTCVTFPLLDKNTWCFRQLCTQQPSGWYHCLSRSGNGDVNVTSCTISTSTLKRLRTNT